MKRSPVRTVSRLGIVLGVAVLAVALLAPVIEAEPRRGGFFVSNDRNRAIPDASDGGGVLSKISVRAGGRIRDLEVGVRINHTFDADLNIYLISPRGKFVELSTDNGGSGNNYGTGPNVCARGTVFDDEARRSIRAGAPPFAGIYRPQTPLRALDGDPIRGVWRLMVFDDDAGSTGTIGCFAMLAVLR
jgi:subtilisin-like proprotein convertase family protein